MLTLLSIALAAPPSGHDQLLARFHDAFSGATGGPVCLTGLVLELRENWALFTPDERAEMTATLAPWTKDLLEPVPRPTTPPPADDAPTDTCIGQYGANRMLGSHFSVEWDSGVTRTDAEQFLDALETAHAIEIDELGWLAPARDDDYLMLAYIASGNTAGAYTSVIGCGNGYVPYIVAYAGSFAGSSDWYETMALHEFNHALQFTYGYGPEFWVWEATATYIEEQVAPDNNWWSTYVVGYAANPQLPLSASSQSDSDIFYHMYGMSTWFFYLDQYQGGPDIARQMWEWSADNGSTYNLNAEELLAGIGYDFDAAYADFIARNAVMQYDEPRLWTPVAETGEVTALPDNGASANRDAPGGYGQNYIRFDGNAGDGELTLTVTLESDEEVKWLVELVEVSDDEVLRAETATGTGALTVSLPQFGGNDVLLVVSPTKHNDRDTYSYQWDARLEEGIVVPIGGDTGTPDETEGGSLDTDLSSGACGCSTGSGANSAGLLALSLGLGISLRRRRP